MGTTGIILAGGKNRRLGRPKALEKVGGITIIERVANRLAPLVDQMVIVTALDTQGLPANLGAKIITDVSPGGGPLVGIYSGLITSDNEKNILVACDMPFLSTPLLAHLVAVSTSKDAVIPYSAPGMFEPLHAVYDRTCIPAIKKRLDNQERAIASFLQDIKVLYVGTAECREYDPERRSFFNINRQPDMDVAQQISEEN